MVVTTQGQMVLGAGDKEGREGTESKGRRAAVAWGLRGALTEKETQMAAAR